MNVLYYNARESLEFQAQKEAEEVSAVLKGDLPCTILIRGYAEELGHWGMNMGGQL